MRWPLILFRGAAEKIGAGGYRIPFQFYVILIFAAGLLPEGMRFPSQPVALAILTERLSSVTAVVLCALLGVMLPRKWHLLGFSAIAAVFFTFLYQDTGKMDRMEAAGGKIGAHDSCRTSACWAASSLFRVRAF